MKHSNEELQRYRNVIMWQSRFSRFTIRCSHLFRDSVGIDLTQVRILFYAAHSPLCSVGRCCEDLSLQPSTVSMALRAIESLGYIERVSSDQDARSIIIRLTDGGYDLISRTKPVFEKIKTMMDEDLADGSFEKTFSQLYKDDLFAFLSERTNYPVTTREAAYEHLHFDEKNDPGHYLTDIALAVESAAKIVCCASRTWAENGLNMRSGRILAYAYLLKSQKLSEIGVSQFKDLLLLQPAEVSAGIMKLERGGLVNRRRGDKDRRMTMVSLTSKGETLIQEALEDNYRKLEETSFDLVDVDPIAYFKAN